jgi:hypothetical protein
VRPHLPQIVGCIERGLASPEPEVRSGSHRDVPPQLSLLGRLAYLVGDIITSPRSVFRNLGNGISQAFSTFIERIDEFLATAFFDWLRGSSGVPVQLPKEWGPSGIFSLFTQLLGLTTETIWEAWRLPINKTIATPFAGLVHKGLEVFQIIRREACWDCGSIQESLGIY